MLMSAISWSLLRGDSNKVQSLQATLFGWPNLNLTIRKHDAN